MKKRFTYYMLIDIWKKFQKKCIDEGVNASAKIQELVVKWLNE